MRNFRSLKSLKAAQIIHLDPTDCSVHVQHLDADPVEIIPVSAATYDTMVLGDIFLWSDCGLQRCINPEAFAAEFTEVVSDHHRPHVPQFIADMAPTHRHCTDLVVLVPVDITPTGKAVVRDENGVAQVIDVNVQPGQVVVYNLSARTLAATPGEYKEKRYKRIPLK